MTRLLLVRHAPTAATRRAAFPADESLDDDGIARAATLAAAVADAHEAVCSPALRARHVGGPVPCVTWSGATVMAAP